VTAEEAPAAPVAPAGAAGPDEAAPAPALQRLSELVRRVNSSTDTAEVLEEIVHGVCEVLGYGVAAIARLEGDTLVMTAVAGPDDVRRQVLGRRTPAAEILDEFRQADRWGILRFVPHGRMDNARLTAAWIPDFEPDDDPMAWHPEDALYAPLYSATGGLLGNMAVDLPTGNRIPSIHERELLEMFVVQAGLALSNAQQRERLAEQVRLGSTVKEVAQAGSQPGIEAILSNACRAVQRGLDATQVWIRCYPDEDRANGVAAGHPRPSPTGAGVGTLRADLSELWPTADPVVVHISDESCDRLPSSLPRLQQMMTSVGAFQVVVMPMGVALSLLGYVVIGFPGSRGPLRASELDAITEIARELGRSVHSARLLETEQRLVSELRELDRYKGELITTISHELKTPLTTIIGHAELLGELHEHRSVEAITRNAERLNRLVQNLLDYSRVQDRRAAVRVDVDVIESCRAAIDLVAHHADTGRVDIELVVCCEQVSVSGDPEDLSLVVDNLVSNAVKYTRPGGTVRIRVACDDNEVRVSVRDSGLGISEADQVHLFSAFHRSSNPEALSIPGTGLGLAISRRIVESHGGRIEVESVVGEGSTFTLALPRAPRRTP
jgi:signal transduction histidine kinase